MRQNITKGELYCWEGLGGYSPSIAAQWLKKTPRRMASGRSASIGHAGRSGGRKSRVQIRCYNLVNALRDAFWDAFFCIHICVLRFSNLIFSSIEVSASSRALKFKFSGPHQIIPAAATRWQPDKILRWLLK